MARVGWWALGRPERPHCTRGEPKYPHCTHSDLCAHTTQGTAGTSCLHGPRHQLLGPVSLQGLLGERVPAFLGQISLPLALGWCSPWLTDIPPCLGTAALAAQTVLAAPSLPA